MLSPRHTQLLAALITKHHFDLNALAAAEQLTPEELLAFGSDPQVQQSLARLSAFSALANDLHRADCRREALQSLTNVVRAATDPREQRLAANAVLRYAARPRRAADLGRSGPRSARSAPDRASAPVSTPPVVASPSRAMAPVTPPVRATPPSPTALDGARPAHARKAPEPPPPVAPSRHAHPPIRSQGARRHPCPRFHPVNFHRSRASRSSHTPRRRRALAHEHGRFSHTADTS